MNTGRRLSLLAAVLIGSIATQAWGSELPSLGEDSSPWQVDLTYENHTVKREHTGLAKFRNTMQAEFDKRASNGWGIHGILRGSWDGVYRMNSKEYGNDAGGSITSQSTVNGSLVTVPWGVGAPPAPPFNTALGGLAQFPATYPNNPNTGLRVLGDRWHGTDGGVGFAVPV
ncbi:MAG TPA: DUF1302 domain-containing protein, partial [Azonexus sp.]|nr:DUF1302 domain-containing protein [Azonexus sp.]